MQPLDWCHCGHQIAGHNDRGICLTWPCGCHQPRPGGEPYQPHGWQPPVAVGDERLGCAYCPWSCPQRYQNASGARVTGGRDGNTRLAEHVRTEHREQHRKAKEAARSRRRYAERKALNAASTATASPPRRLAQQEAPRRCPSAGATVKLKE